MVDNLLNIKKSILRYFYVFSIITILCFITVKVFAQQPAYFLIGEDQFKGIQVYDVAQDNDESYWFTTNNGIYFYNGNKFEQIQCPEAKSISFFNLVVNSEGTLFCKNLNNQIFQIKNRKATLFHTLTKNEVYSDVLLIVNQNDELMIFSKVIKVIDKNGNLKNKINLYNHYCGQPLLTSERTVISHLNNSDSLIQYKNGNFYYQKINFKTNPNPLPISLSFFQIGNNFYAIDQINKNTYLYKDKQFHEVKLNHNAQLKKTEFVRLYQTSKGLWIKGGLLGISLESNSYNSFASTIFNDYFISDVYEDKEGNVLLSTFNEGVIVIPDLNINDAIKIKDNDIISKINCINDSIIFLGTSKGKLLMIKNKNFITLSSSGTRTINIIEKFPNDDWLLIDNGKIRAINYITKQNIDILYASLKGVVFLNNNEFYLGTNRGVYFVKRNGNHFSITPNIHNFNSRVYNIKYDEVNKILYVATSDGLFSLQDGNVVEIKIMNKSLFVNAMDIEGQSLYIFSDNYGICVINKTKIISTTQYNYYNQELTVQKIIAYNNTLLAETYNGFYQIDLANKSIKALHYTYGFLNNRIIDFDIFANQLWVSNSRGVQKVNLDYKLKPNNYPKIRLDAYKVNNKYVSESTLQRLSHAQNKIQFDFSTNTIKNLGSIRYNYRLLGSDTTWQINNFTQNSVIYNALSPGSYTFQIRVVNQGFYSEIKEVHFKIYPAFYLRWWFIVATLIIFLIIVYFVYHWQLELQKRKMQRINELNTSKLTAIKSQMNPHFIFNSLNSIQDLILKGDVENSYSYISTFSNMVRVTLTNSEREFIDIEQEVKLLELYLSLEKLRFKKDFDYQLDIEQNLDVLIPPMLIQPFIENALVHGLLHKNGTKKISIHILLEDELICIIEDNGIGRKAALEIKNRQQRHESFSSQAIKKRFEILSKVYKGNFGYEYEDILRDNEVFGTRVTLKMPFQLKY